MPYPPDNVLNPTEIIPSNSFPKTYPVVPEIVWIPNADVVGKISLENTYTDAGREIMSVTADFPSVSVPWMDEYYAGALADTEYRCDKLSEEAKALGQNGTLSKAYSYSESFDIELNANGLISIRRNVILDTDIGLPNVSVICDTFRVADGAMLTLDDFFTVSQEIYTRRLLDRVRQYISDNLDSLFTDAADVAAETFPYDNFCVTQAGLSLFYPEQTIAPQSSGVIRIDVPWEFIGDILSMPE